MSTSQIANIIAVQKSKIAQIVSGVLTTKQATTLTTVNTFVAVTSPTVTITPTNASSRIILFISLSNSGKQSTANYYFQVLRDSTVIGGGNGGTTLNCSFGSAALSTGRQTTVTAIEYDLPGDTSAHTYSLKVASDVATDELDINRTNGDANTTATACCASSIVAMEVLP
jgi:hypothetical protein